MKRIVLVFMLVAGCKARFNPDVPRAYRCSTKGSDECPGKWVCSLTAGFCIDPEAGRALPCATDDECGGGWRCSPNRLCVDRSVEGQLKQLPPLTAVTRVSPNLPEEGPLQTSQPVIVTLPTGYAVGTDVLFDSHGWLRVEDDVAAEGMETSYSYSSLPDAATLVTTRLGPSGFVHSAWALDDAGVSVLSVSDDGRVVHRSAGMYAGVRGLRTSGLADRPDWRGGALLSTDAVTWLVRDDLDLDAGLALPRSSDVVLTPPRCPVTFVAASDAGLLVRLSDGGSESWSSTAVELRTSSNGFLGWRRVDDTVAWVDLCHGGDVNVVEACPAASGGGTLRNWNLVERNGGALPTRTCDIVDAGRQYNVIGRGAGRVIYDPLVLSGEGTTTWARATDSNIVMRFSPEGVQDDITLPGVPDSLFRLPGDGGLVVATRGPALYSSSGLGFLRVRMVTDPATAVATGDGRFTVFSGGVVVAETWAVAFAPSEWNTPRAPVLMRRLRLPDAGTLLALTHDDLIDMAQLKQATKEVVELAPTVAPLPGFAVSDVALAVSSDGGLTGYAIAGGSLVALSATTPTRWQSTRVNLPLDALHVWFDGALPRAILSDGTVLGLTATVGLTPPTPAPAIAATTLCGTPLVLTEDALYQLADGGWTPVDGIPEDVNFAGGGLRTLDSRVYVFDSVGHAWSTAFTSCP